MKDPSPDTDLGHLKQSVRDQLIQDPLGRTIDELRDRLKDPTKEALTDVIVDKGLEKLDRNCSRMLGRCGVPTVPPGLLEELKKVLSPSAADAAEIVLRRTPSCQPDLPGSR
jgi:hypothetical protein